MKKLRLVIVIPIFVLALCGSHVNAQITRYVNGDGVCGGATPCYTTIQDAVAAASEGDTIMVASGTYSISGTITINENLHIYGANYGISGQSLSRGTASTLSYSGGYYFTLSSGTNAEIDGFDYNGINFIQSSGDSLYVRNCNFTWNSSYGDNDIYLSDVFKYFIFQYNNVILTGDVGAALQPVGNYSGSGTASKVLIDGNYFNNTGMPTYSEPINLSSCQGQVSNNTIVNVENGIIVADNCGNLNITGNDFEGIEDGYDTDYLSGVKLSYSPLSGPLTITNNFFNNCDYDVNTSGAPDFSANTVDIHQNSFTSIGFDALRNAGTGTFSANCNWYGVTDSATIASVITGDVNFLPWLVNGTDGDTITAGFQPATACLAPCNLVLSPSATATCPSTSYGAVSVSVSSGGSGTYTYSWSPGGQTSSALTGLAIGSYTVAVTDVNGCTATDSASVTDYTLPTATVSGGGIVCGVATHPNVNIELTGTPPWSLTYSIDGVNQTPVTGIEAHANPYIIQHADSGTYIVTALSDSNCTGTSFSGSATVSLYPRPTAAVSGGGAICTGATLPNVTFTLTGTAPWTLTYSINGVNQTPVTGISSSPYIITEASAGRYIVTALSDANCAVGTSFTGSATVTVNAYPVPTALPTDTTFCSGVRTSIVLTSNLSGTTWSYTPTVTGGSVYGAVSGTTATISQLLYNTGTTTALVTYSILASRSGCTSAAIYSAVNIYPKPSGTATPSSVYICSASQTGIALDTGGVVGTTFTWTYIPGANITGADTCLSSCGTLINQTLYNSGTVNSKITYSITPWANGCQGTLFTATAIVRPIPVASTSTSSFDYSLCNGISSNVLLTSPTGGGVTYSYTADSIVNPAGGSITGYSDGSGSRIRQYLANSGTSVGSVFYLVTPSYYTCQGNPIQIEIDVQPVATGFATQTSSDTLLNGDSTDIVLQFTAVDNTTFTWIPKNNVYITGAALCSDSSHSGSCGSAIVNTLYNLVGANEVQGYTITPWANGCAGTKFVHNVLIRPIPTARQNNYAICSGGKTKVLLSSIPGGSSFTYSTSLISPAGGTITGFSGGSGLSGTSIIQVLVNTGTSTGKVVYAITPDYYGSVGGVTYDTVTVNPVALGSATPSPVGMCGDGSSTTGITLVPTIGGIGTYFTWKTLGNHYVFGSSTCSASCGTTINDPLTTNVMSSIKVYVITPWTDGCAGTVFQENVTIHSSTIAPPAPILNGPVAGICPYPQTYTYTVTNLAPFDSVTWSLPAGSTVAGGYTLNSNPIVMSFPSTYVIPFVSTDSVWATVKNLCGVQSASLASLKPSPTGGISITGNRTGLCGATSQAYSIGDYPGHSYSWSATSGITITSDNTASSITADFSSGLTTGTITCTLAGCGADTAFNLIVSGIPELPNAISGPATHCASSGPYTYSTGAVFGATSYIWTLPTGGSASSDTTSVPSISVTFTGSTTGYIYVKASNDCGQSAARSAKLTVNCRVEGAPDDQSEMNMVAYPNPTHDLLNVVFNSNLSNTNYTIKLIDITGRTVMSRVNTEQTGTNIIQVDLTSYAKGVYMIILNNGESEQKERIVVE